MNDSVGVPSIELQAVEKTYVQGGVELQVLTGIDFSVNRGEVVALVGPSGSGKSTLLHIAGLLERPNSGHVVINGRVCDGLADSARTELRREALGFVYQFHHLLPEFSAQENVELPQMIGGTGKKKAEEAARKLLGRFGLSQRLSHRPSQLSGGEQQRVAIARAVVNRPAVLLADEPTGNLDPKTAEQVYDELLSFVRDDGLAAVIATHNMDLAAAMDRTFVIEEGILKEA